MKLTLTLLASLQMTTAFAPQPSKSAMSTSVLRSTTTETATTTDKVVKPMFSEFLDEEALLQRSTFPIAPADLMIRAKEILSPDCAIGTKDGGACLAPDFEFCAAVVGPIGREAYLGALGTFNLEEAFEQEPNFFGMTVDPMQTNRVWFFNRVRATHIGEFQGAEASGKAIEYPPQVLHMDLNEEGQMVEFGFYTADRRQGNTGGLGGAFGFMYGVGKPLPIPECQPYQKSWQFRLLSFVGNLAQKRNEKE